MNIRQCHINSNAGQVHSLSLERSKPEKKQMDEQEEKNMKGTKKTKKVLGTLSNSTGPEWAFQK